MKEFETLENLTASPEDSRDYIYYPTETKATSPVVDLIPQVHEVEHQGSTNSCTANAGCTALEIMYGRAGEFEDFSRMFLYWNVRKLGNMLGKDGGAFPRHIGQALKDYGVPKESYWQFTTENISKTPTRSAYMKAEEHKVIEYRRVSSNIDDIRNAVLNGIPVLTTIWIRPSFYSLKGDWRTHDWSDTKSRGSHEVVIVGFCDKSERFLVQNSWGSRWGDGGFYGLPYAKVGKDAYEFWVLNDVGVPLVPFEDAEILEADYYDPKEYSNELTPNPKRDYTDYYQQIQPTPPKPEPIPEPEPKVVEPKKVKKDSSKMNLLLLVGVVAIVIFAAVF